MSAYGRACSARGRHGRRNGSSRQSRCSLLLLAHHGERGLPSASAAVLLYGTWTALTLFGACERPGVTLQEVLEGNDVFQDADTEKAVDADKAAAVGIEVSPVRPGAEQGRGATA